MSIRLFELIQNLIKYSVVCGTIAMTAHVGLLLTGYDLPLADWLVGLSVCGFIVLMLSSYCLRLCGLFRSMLTYIFVVSQCIRIQREFGMFNPVLQESRLAVFTAGVALVAYFLANNKEYRQCSNRRY